MIWNNGERLNRPLNLDVDQDVGFQFAFQTPCCNREFDTEEEIFMDSPVLEGKHHCECGAVFNYKLTLMFDVLKETSYTP